MELVPNSKFSSSEARATWQATAQLPTTWFQWITVSTSPKSFQLNVQLKWEVTRDPLHRDIDINKPCGVGTGMLFANSVKSRLGVIGRVPCARGGSSIKEWEKGDKHYENMIKRAKAIVKVGGDIKTLLWYQGENDTFNLNDVENYKRRLEKLLQNVRTDLNMHFLPILQVIIESVDGPLKDEVIKQQKALSCLML
ncbi:Hypothetical predicted protein [Olea europaea subsp. europaea]|uniref:Sialate O-acetylesterase domain-containing protein n=1 Tax=Olea europaea subsp. europaea TaxID=158383 RepID=A0A8S0UQ67_OLEEU|nr:Hypothetical predicted protein [Olea europaea subsp. europaea]